MCSDGSLLKRITPNPIKRLLKPVAFRLRYGFPSPPLWSDTSGYDCLLDIVIHEKLYEVSGDFVEIGAFLGGGHLQIVNAASLVGARQALDDYGRDLPQVTEAIHTLIGENAGEIQNVWRTGLKTIAIKKKPQPGER